MNLFGLSGCWLAWGENDNSGLEQAKGCPARVAERLVAHHHSMAGNKPVFFFRGEPVQKHSSWPVCLICWGKKMNVDYQIDNNGE